jgi:4'-phosphopantetheinyl transferase
MTGPSKGAAAGLERLREHGWEPTTDARVEQGEIGVWWLDLVALGRALEPSSLLSADEKRRAGRFIVDRARRRWVASRMGLRTVLGRALGCDAAAVAFDLGAYGKPRLVGTTGLEFSLTHAGEAGLVALSRDGAVGVDLEHMERRVDAVGLALSVFSRAEQIELMALPEAERRDAFFRGWTRKEAFIKALGEGLSHPLDAFDVHLRAGESRCLLATRSAPQSSTPSEVCDVATPRGWYAAVAMGAPVRPIRRHLLVP